MSLLTGIFSVCALLRSANPPRTQAPSRWSSRREYSHDNVTRTESLITLQVMVLLGARHDTQPELTLFLIWKGGRYYQPYFTAEDPGAQRDSVTFPRVHSAWDTNRMTLRKGPSQRRLLCVPHLGPGGSAMCGRPLTSPRTAGPSQPHAQSFWLL